VKSETVLVRRLAVAGLRAFCSLPDAEAIGPRRSEWFGTFQEKSASSLKAMHMQRGPLVKSQAKPKR
jgi:hypothetical protein